MFFILEKKKKLFKKKHVFFQENTSKETVRKGDLTILSMECVIKMPIYYM